MDWIGAESAQVSRRNSRIYQTSLSRFLIEALDIYSKVQHRSAYMRQQFAQNLQFFCIGRLCRGRVKHKPILPGMTEGVINHLLNFSIIEPCLFLARPDRNTIRHSSRNRCLPASEQPAR